jgi:aryl-alcohol dehydrogenase-like predicted oxidoreductase
MCRVTAGPGVAASYTIERRSFGGGTGVSMLGVGCGRVASINNPVPTREIEATLEAAVEAGINLFDTADIYGQGDSERTLSRLLRRYRDRMFVVTKVGGRHGRYAGVIRIAKPLLRVLVRSSPRLRGTVVRARTATVTYNYHPHDLGCAIEGSRRRLRLDHLDGLLLHNPSIETLRDPGIHDFFAELLRGRRSRHVGVSVETVAEVEAALSMPSPLTIIQLPLAAANALSGTGLVERIRQRQIGIFVRGILRRPPAGIDNKLSLHEAVSAAIAPNLVTAAIVGVSTRRHLNELLSVLS